MQAVIDGADPLTYAPHVLRDRFTIGGAQLGPRSVVAIEVARRPGALEPRHRRARAGARPRRARAAPRAARRPRARSPSPAAGNRDGQTAVLVQYAPATHGAQLDAPSAACCATCPASRADGDEPFPRLPARDHDRATRSTRRTSRSSRSSTTHLAGEAPRVRIDEAAGRRLRRRRHARREPTRRRTIRRCGSGHGGGAGPRRARAPRPRRAAAAERARGAGVDVPPPDAALLPRHRARRRAARGRHARPRVRVEPHERADRSDPRDHRRGVRDLAGREVDAVVGARAALAARPRRRGADRAPQGHARTRTRAANAAVFDKIADAPRAAAATS